MLSVVNIPLLSVVLWMHCFQSLEETLVLSRYPVHVGPSLHEVEASLWFPVTAMINTPCGVHDVVHPGEELVVVTLDDRLTIFFNLLTEARPQSKPFMATRPLPVSNWVLDNCLV